MVSMHLFNHASETTTKYCRPIERLATDRELLDLSFKLYKTTIMQQEVLQTAQMLANTRQLDRF